MLYEIKQFNKFCAEIHMHVQPMNFELHSFIDSAYEFLKLILQGTKINGKIHANHLKFQFFLT